MRHCHTGSCCPLVAFVIDRTDRKADILHNMADKAETREKVLAEVHKMVQK
jgi:hypothetical protein